MDELAAGARLCEYARRGYLQRAKLMLDAKCSISVRDYANVTPLHVGACAAAPIASVLPAACAQLLSSSALAR
eukprot:4716461-Pleurochrysis_carterae.AAC.1